MLRKLSERVPALVEHHRHGAVSLTPEGRRAALRTLRRHRLIELFLIQTLGYSWDEVHSEAEQLEHAVSPLFEERVARFLEQPRFDPHGDPIPDQDLAVPSRQAVPLTRLRAGSSAVVSRVPSGDPEALRYLERLGLTPGAELRLLESRPLDQTLLLEVAGGEGPVVVGYSLAEQVEVGTEEPGIA
jgi:DtxR family Mn-dependent transcriptional regulator